MFAQTLLVRQRGRKKIIYYFFYALPFLHNSEGFELSEFKKCLETLSGTWCDSWVGPVQGQELD